MKKAVNGGESSFYLRMNFKDYLTHRLRSLEATLRSMPSADDIESMGRSHQSAQSALESENAALRERMLELAEGSKLREELVKTQQVC